MIKWAAAMDWRDTIITRAVEARETPKTYQVKERVDALNYSLAVLKKDNLLFDTKREALEALLLRLVARRTRAIAECVTVNNAWKAALNALEELD